MHYGKPPPQQHVASAATISAGIVTARTESNKLTNVNASKHQIATFVIPVLPHFVTSETSFIIPTSHLL